MNLIKRILQAWAIWSARAAPLVRFRPGKEQQEGFTWLRSLRLGKHCPGCKLAALVMPAFPVLIYAPENRLSPRSIAGPLGGNSGNGGRNSDIRAREGFFNWRIGADPF